MKYAFAVLLVLAGPVLAIAQKNNLYADAGLCLAYLDPGASVTYNYNPNRHIGLGGGVQEYSFHTTVTNIHQLTSAIYGEFRFNMRQRKKGQYFSFLDIGMDIYKQNNSYYHDGAITYSVPGNNGTYAGFGAGYMHYTTPRRGGLYVSLKMITNWYKSDTYDAVSNEFSTKGLSDGTLVVSAGFKF